MPVSCTIAVSDRTVMVHFVLTKGSVMVGCGMMVAKGEQLQRSVRRYHTINNHRTRIEEVALISSLLTFLK